MFKMQRGFSAQRNYLCSPFVCANIFEEFFEYNFGLISCMRKFVKELTGIMILYLGRFIYGIKN